jgi:hypothetical protein
MAEPIDLDELADEVAAAGFVDKRLAKRVRALIAAVGSDPSLSLPEALDSAELEGAYRFFSNVHVTPEAILAGHFEATGRRCEERGEVLVAHDTTTFSYRYDGQRRGLGRTQRTSPRSSQAFYAHLSLALAADGTRRPLGVASFKAWTRGDERDGNEHRRWEEQMRAASSTLGSSVRAIHLADREADDYEMFCALARDGLRFVVRCQYNRLLQSSSGKLKLFELFSGLNATAQREVPLQRRTERRTDILRKIHPAREGRVATVNVAGATVQLKKPSIPRKYSNEPPALSVNVVRVWEPAPPEGETPTEWYLYTSEPIETAEQLLAIVDHYRARWLIEEYFKAIKDGCKFEKRQLHDYEGLVNLLATFVPIAYRVLLIRQAARDPEPPPALDVVSQDELDVLRKFGRRQLPAAPNARDVYLAVAALGGHIKYKKSDPGWLTLSRGYEKLATLTEGWIAGKMQSQSDQP